MIFYFSGTGNSKWIAQEIAKGTGDEAVDMVSLRNIQAPAYEPQLGETIGFVFPIYAWRVPQYVLDFASEISWDDSHYVFAVCTCGGEAGNALDRFSQSVPLQSKFSVQMPNNYIKGMAVSTEEQVASYISHAKC